MQRSRTRTRQSIMVLTAAAGATLAFGAGDDHLSPHPTHHVGETDRVERADPHKMRMSIALPAARTGGTAGELCDDATLLTCNDAAGYDYDNSKTSGGWDVIDLNDPDQNFCIGNTGESNRHTYWFKFVATDTSAQVHTCDTIGGTDSSMQLYSGSCAGLAEIGCAEDNCGASTFNGYIYAEGLTIGQTYYIQVGSWSAGAAGAYNIKVVCPAPDCVACDAPAPVLDNDGPCLFEDFVQNGDPADTPSVPSGSNNNFGCIEPDEGDPPRIQSLGIVEEVMVCGETFLSTRSDSPATTFFRDYDWYDFVAPTDGDTATFETLQYDFTANGQKGFFILQLGVDNARGCDGDTGIDPDIYFAAFEYVPWSSANGGVGDCNVHNINTVLLEDSETYNLVIRTTRDHDGPATCTNPIGIKYTLEMDFPGPEVGACCLPDDTCVDGIAEFDCFGIYRGDDVGCATLPAGSECPDPLPCPPGGMIEALGMGEILGFNDVINVGCNAEPDPITGQVVPIAPDLVMPGETWCGSTGNFQGNTRDLDWYRFVMPTDGELTISMDAQVPMVLFLVETFDGNNFTECEAETVIAAVSSIAKNETIVLSATACAGDYYIIPATNDFTGYQVQPGVNEAWDYVFSVIVDSTLLEVGACCLPDATCIETDPCNCGKVDGLYYGEGSICTDANVLCCADICKLGDTIEGEPACFDGYQDFYNSGCNAMDFPDFQNNGYYFANDPDPDGSAIEIDPFIDAALGQTFCGTTGEFFTDIRLRDGRIWPNEDVRDTDWYRISHAGGTLYASMHAEQFTGQVFLYEETNPAADLCDLFLDCNPVIPECQRYTLNRANITVAPCTPDTLDFGSWDPGLYYLVVAGINTVFGPDFSCTNPKEYRFAYGIALCECPNVDDSDGLGEVNLDDLITVLFNFGTTVSHGEDGDADCDGDCDLQDLMQVLFAFGTSPGC